MATSGGTSNPALIQPYVQALLKEVPFEFDFFQAVRLLERVFPHREIVGRFSLPLREVARFGAHPHYAFPASQIQALEWRETGPPLMIVNFMGLTGPQGVMPLYVTQLLMDRLRAKDRALRDFFDLFNHRMISLFYQAWEKYRFPVVYERGLRDDVDRASRPVERDPLESGAPDKISHYLLDFMGLGTRGLHHRQAVSDDSFRFYTGLLSLHTRSALALKQILADYFEVPVEVEQFVGAWYRLAPANQCQFNRGDSYSEQLGIGAVVGDEIWDQQSGVRVRLGPLTLAQYLDFLPNGTAHAPLRAITRFFAGDELDFEVQLILKREEVPGCELGRLGDAAPQLGWITWAKSVTMARDPDDTILRL